MRARWILTRRLSCLLAFAMANGMPAQNREALTQPKVPLEQFLNRDGTLNLENGFRGSVDPAGWQMQAGPNGEPRFVPAGAAYPTASSVQLMAAPGDENWDDSFFLNGTDRYINALAADGNGNIYAGGVFTSAGGIRANYIAKWDGSNWSALGSGMNSTVADLEVDGNGNVYAGGSFTTAGGNSVNYVAKWDGNNWSALGTGMNSAVMALAVDGAGNLYAGGFFTMAGGVSANYIAKWNGASWSALGTGMSVGPANGLPLVRSLAVDGSGNLYAGGDFFKAGGITVNHIAKWNGSSWSALGSGTAGTVLAVAADGSGNVYVGGQFLSIGGVNFNSIAKWNGSSWSPLGSGMAGSSTFSTVTIRALVVDGDGNLYAGGSFATAGGVNANCIAKWNGSSWSALGSGVNPVIVYGSGVFAILPVGNEVLYVGGSFMRVGGIAANNFARWDGSAWSKLGTDGDGINALVYALAVDGSGNVYAGGLFTNAGGLNVNYIAKWDGNSWTQLGGGMNERVTALALDSNGNLYAAGLFTSAGGVSAKYIAKWDGTNWSALGSGMNDFVVVLMVDDDDYLYAGGLFTLAGGSGVNRIAKWDGSTWSAIGTGMNAAVTALAQDGNGAIYAGGDFTVAGSVPANRVAMWNGSSWSSLGAGVNGQVRELLWDGNGNLYVGGAFTTAGGSPANRIAKWNGAAWSALGSGVEVVTHSDAGALAMDGNGHLYVGGYFNFVGGVSANYIAKWDGSNWSALGSGLNGYPHVLHMGASGHLYAAGDFSLAGDKVSLRMARYSTNQPPTVSAGGPYSANEGGSVMVTATGGDPENGPLTYAWDLDNDGSFETSGQSPAFSAEDLDGPSDHIITVQVTDNGGLAATAEAIVNVINVAPAAAFTATPATIIMGQSTTLAFSEPADPGTADAAAGFKYSFDYTNDGTFEISEATANSQTHAYPASGIYTAAGRIQDKDGGFTGYTIQVTVLTPQDAVRNLIAQVQALNKPQGNGLIGKLNVVIKRLDDNRIDKAIEMLQEFIAQVEVFLGNGIFTAAQGEPLIEAANAIIAALSSSAQAAGLEKEAGKTPAAGAPPTEFQLAQNSPNPFNPATTIQFSVPRPSHVRLKVYNSSGAEVATLVDRQIAAGIYKINWDAGHFASGIYLYRLEAEGFVAAKRLLLMK